MSNIAGVALGTGLIGRGAGHGGSPWLGLLILLAAALACGFVCAGVAIVAAMWGVGSG